MTPGEKIGEGATAEVFAWGDDCVLKLQLPHVDRTVIEYEATVTRAVHASGAPAPEVLDVVEVEGRLGIVYPRYRGKSLRWELLMAKIGPSEAGAQMAVVHHSLHAPAYAADLLEFRSFIARSLAALTESSDLRDVARIAARVGASLPGSGTVCHGDLHLDNILMTTNGPVILDWTSAMSANPLVDVARQWLTLTVLPIESEHPMARHYDTMRPAVAESYLHTHARLFGQAPAELAKAMQPYAVVMAAARMAEPASTPLEREILTGFIREHVG